MSVYTEVSTADLDRFLQAYDLGPALTREPILDGVENTNYFVSTAGGRHVLTLFEATPPADLPFFLALMAHLANRGLPAPRPRAGRDGTWLRELCARPAALVERLPGQDIARPTPGHCAAVGTLLGHLHLAVADFPLTRESTRGEAWRRATAALVTTRASPDDRALLHEELALQAARPLADLPAGVVHGDLFRDNVLFDGARLSGVIDFYYAAREAFLYDLAVAASDWCFSGGHFDRARLRAMLAAYQAVRRVQADERDAWPTALRAAGLRFWLSRLQDSLFRKPGALVLVKDPADRRAVLFAARREPERLRDCWE